MNDNTVLFLIPIAGTISLAAFLAVIGWARERRREREALYRHETARRLVDQGKMSNEELVAFLREEVERPARARRDGLRLAGVLLAALGLGMLIAMRSIEDQAARHVGYIPLFLGIPLMIFAPAGASRVSKKKND